MIDARRPAWVDDELFPFKSRFLELDGNVVHYVDDGEGPTLLLLHGNPVWSFVYRDVISTLRARFRCVALDVPGFGLSSASPGYRYRAEDHAAVLTAFLDELDLNDVTLVGHNWGGPLGLRTATQHPERFDRFVLSNTWAWPLNGDPSSELFSRGMGNPIGRALLRRSNLLVHAFIPSAHKRRKLTDHELAHYRHPTATPDCRRAAAALPGELVGARRFFTALTEQLPSVQQTPTLILWADTDPIFTDKYRRRLEQTFPNHTTTTLHNTGHFLQSDAPAEFSHAIEHWSDQLDRA